MVREGISLRMAVMKLGRDLDAAECDVIFKRKAFQETLREEQNKHYSAVAQIPGRSKTSAIGLLLVAIERLALEGEWAQVIAGVEKLAKLEGWVGAETNVNVFAGLTAKDISEARERIKNQIDNPSGVVSETLPN